MSDRDTIEFVRRQAGAAKYVTSVSTPVPLCWVLLDCSRGSEQPHIGPLLNYCRHGAALSNGKVGQQVRVAVVLRGVRGR